MSPEELEQMIQEADINGDGNINYEEFMKMLVRKKKDTICHVITALLTTSRKKLGSKVTQFTFCLFLKASLKEKKINMV